MAERQHESLSRWFPRDSNPWKRSVQHPFTHPHAPNPRAPDPPFVALSSDKQTAAYERENEPGPRNTQRTFLNVAFILIYVLRFTIAYDRTSLENEDTGKRGEGRFSPRHWEIKWKFDLRKFDFCCRRLLISKTSWKVVGFEFSSFHFIDMGLLEFVQLV